MERLTYVLIAPKTGEVLAYKLNPGVTDTQAKTKLGKHEDLEEQGRLQILPCKVGDVVFHENEYATRFKGLQPYQITNIMISQNKKGIWTKKYRAMMLLDGRIIDSQINFSFDDIGKTVFLTREEAEAALEKMKGEEHE